MKTIANTIKKRAEMWIFIGGFVFFGVRGLIDFMSLNELESGKVDATQVWAPVANLYEAYGLPYALLPHLFFVLLFLAAAIRAVVSYSKARREIGATGIEQIKKHDKEVYESRHIAGKQLSPMKRLFALLGAGILVSLVLFGGIILLAKMQ